MQEKEFIKLLEKYIKGTLSEEESELLKKTNEKLKSKIQESNFQNEAYKLRLKESILSEVSVQTKYSFWKTVVSVAVIFIGILLIGYFYLQVTKPHNAGLISKNVITLQLEDGSIKTVEEYGNIKILNKEGRVAGRQSNNQLVYENVNSSQKKIAYNILTVPYGKTFKLQLSDGTIAHLNAGTSIKYPVQFLKNMDRQVYIVGEVFLDVAKDLHKPFIVSTDNLNVRVLGAKLNVCSYPEENTEIVLVEGSIDLYSEESTYNEGRSTKIKSGIKAVFDKKNKSITEETVTTNIYTLWIKGELIFRDMFFKNIVRRLERHYDVTIINKNKNLSKEKLNINFGKIPIEKVFENLDIYYGIDYTIEGDTITVK